MGPTQQKIYDYIRSHEPTYTYAIHQDLGIHRGNVTTVINSLLRRGLVKYCDEQPKDKSGGPQRKWLQICD